MGTEATPSTRTSSPPAPAGDPYFYGWRMVPRWEDRGGQTWEKMPLTPWDVLHPEEDDFIVHNDAHDRDIHYLKAVFEEQVAGRAGVKVLCDHRVHWGVTDLGAHAPDVVVFEKLNKSWDSNRGTFPVKEMGARPLVVVEVTSPSTRYIDFDEKIEEYHRAGVPLYVVADRRESADGRSYVTLLGHRSTPEGYVRIPHDPKGVWVEPLKLWILADGDRVACADEHDNRIPDRAGLRDQRDTEKAARLAAEQKLKGLEAELKRLRGE
jgi:colicin import membrane protein